MENKDLCEHTRICLIAAAVGHQQCTKTAANVVPIPGTEKYIVVGTAVEVMDVLAAQLPRGGETNIAEDVAALFGACGFEIRSTDPGEQHPFAVAGSLDAAGLVAEKLLSMAPPALVDALDSYDAASQSADGAALDLPPLEHSIDTPDFYEMACSWRDGGPDAVLWSDLIDRIQKYARNEIAHYQKQAGKEGA